jgi:transposase
MPLISEQVHPLSLDFENQRKVVIRRSHFKEAWSTIAGKVKNLAGDSPSDKLVARVYKTFSKKAGRRRYKYKRCGRRPWKLTKPIQQWLIRTLRNARRSSICTSTTLQQKLAKVKGIQVEASAIRRLLCRKGYHWLQERETEREREREKGKQKRKGGRGKVGRWREGCARCTRPCAHRTPHTCSPVCVCVAAHQTF